MTGTTATSSPPHAARNVAQRVWYGLLTQAVDKVLPVLILLYLARVLEPAAFGVYAFIIAYLAFFQIISDYSIDTVLVRMMSQQPDDRDELLRAGLALKLMMSLVSAVVAVAFVGPASGDQTPPVLMAVAALNLPTALGGAYRAWQRSRLEIGTLFLQAALRATLLAGGVVVAVWSGAGLVAIFASMSVANLLTFLIIAASMRGRVRPGLSFDPARWRAIAAGVWPLMVNAFAMTLSLRAGQILLMSMRGPVDVGLLGAASRVTEAFTLLPEALMISVYPMMADLHSRESPALLRTAARSSRYLVAITGLPVVACAVAGRGIMSLLFGSEFVEAGPILSLLAFMALLSATGTVILNVLVATHGERVLSRNTLAFAAVNLVLSVLLIRSHGAIGAAAAMLATSAASQLSLAVIPSTRQYVRAALVPALRAFAAVAIAVIAGKLSGLSATPLLVLSILVYVAAAAVLGVFGADEWRLLKAVRSGPKVASVPAAEQRGDVQ
ncbi:MAG TPA: flippase [Candidatus Limnocylindrales bacterium]|nr:flippase [Candidatus Limnocylindrales bacterium]